MSKLFFTGTKLKVGKKTHPTYLNIMNIANTLTEKLPIFINELRCAGYNIGTAQFIAVQNLILALAKRGKLPAELAQLKTLLAPILCHTQKEQQEFASHFDNWKQTIEVSEEIRRTEEVAILDTPKKVGSTKKWAIITTVIFLVMLIGGLVFYQFVPMEQETPPPETTDVSEPPPSSPELPRLPEPETIPKSPEQQSDLPKETSELPEPQTYLGWMLLALPLIFLLLGYLWRRHFARLYLARQYTSVQPDIQKLPVKTVEESIFQPFDLSYSAQQLRKHISVESNHLDITATIDKSIEAGNWFTPVRGTLIRRPEYLVLIDRLTFKDHQTKLVDTLINQLVNEEVLVNRYYFDATPRRCYPEDKHLAPLTLTELAERYPTHKLLIFSDGNGFINPITGKIVHWINQLSIWTHRTLFTLETSAQWGYREKLLKEEADFLIMPANEAGLKFLVEQINANTRQSYPFPLWQRENKIEYLNENFNRWLERHAPDTEVLTELLTQVKSFLGTDGYYWFCACAVYPQLHWHLTLYLGDKLKSAEGKKLFTEENLAKLARLPWFRYGYMPDWLRERLVTDLLAQQKDEEIRSVIAEFLQPEESSETKKVDVAVGQPSTEGKIIREHVFLQFMADKLAVKVSLKNVRNLLFDNFQKYALPTLIIFAVTIWFSFYEWNFYQSEIFCKLSEIMEGTCVPEPIPSPKPEEEKFFWLAEMVGGAISKPQRESKSLQALAKMAGGTSLVISKSESKEKLRQAVTKILKQTLKQTRANSEPPKNFFQCTGFNIISSILRPTITAVIPSHVPQNSTADILITAPTANFNPSSSVKIDDIVDDIVVNQTNFLSPSQVTANITIGTISPQFYDISVETKTGLFKTEFTQGKCALEIIPTPDKPQIISISPNKAELDSTIEVDIYGINTNFDLLSSKLDINNPKITAKVIQIISANHLKATIGIAKTARVGFQKINIITGDKLAKDTQLAGSLLVLSSLGKMRRKISSNQQNSTANIIRIASADSEFGNISTHSETLKNPFGLGKVIFTHDIPLEIKAIAPTTIKQSENIIYTIKVTNISDMIATGVVLESALSEGIRLSSIESLDKGNCSINTTSCELPDLMPNEITTVKIIGSVTQPEVLTNIITVTSNESPANLIKRWTKVLPYLSVSVNDVPDPVMVKNILLYKFDVELSEYAPNPMATGVTLTTKLPDGIQFKSVANNYGHCDTRNLPSIICTINNLNKNDASKNRANINIEVIVNDPGILSLKLEAKISANEYPAYITKARTKISLGNEEADIALVIDTTASMQPEINAIIKAIENFIVENDLGTDPTFALVAFKDNIKIRAVTKNLNVLLKAVKSLKTSGGGLCPEASMEALKVAISFLKKGGTILLSTDASPYDDSNVMEIAKLMRKKGIYFNAMISGACNW